MDWLWLVREFSYLAHKAFKRGDDWEYQRFMDYWDVAFQMLNLELRERLAH